MQETLTVYACTADWAGKNGFTEVAMPEHFAPAPRPFRDYEGGSLGSVQTCHLISQGSSLFVDEDTHRRLLDEGIERHRGLWASLAKK